MLPSRKAVSYRDTPGASKAQISSIFVHIFGPISRRVHGLVPKPPTGEERGLAGIADPAQRRTLTIGLIAELLVEGLMIAGDVDEHGHQPWPHSMGDAIERITRTWLTEWPEDIPTPGAIVWLANTEAGNLMGREVLARETESY